MNVGRVFGAAGAIVLSCSALGWTSVAQADDPLDPTMTPEAIARDSATIRRMNRQQYDYVRERDARYAQGWRDSAEARAASSEARDRQSYARMRADYADSQRQYEEAMQRWEADVAACRDGYYERCARR